MDDKDPFGLKNNENMLDLTKSDESLIEIIEDNQEDKTEPSLTYYEDHISLEKPRYEELTGPLDTTEETQIIEMAVVSDENKEDGSEPPVYALVPVPIVIDEILQDKKLGFFARLFAKLRKSKKGKNKEPIVGEALMVIPEKPQKKKSNLKVLLPVLGVLVLIAGTNFVLKGTTGSDLMETIKNGFGGKEDTVALNPNHGIPTNNQGQTTVPSPDPNSQSTTDPNQPTGTDPNQGVITDPNQGVITDPNQGVITDPSANGTSQSAVDSPEITELKTKMETLESDSRFLSLKFNLENVEMIEPTIFVKGTISSKKANMVDMNRLVREIQMSTVKQLKRPYTSVQVQLSRGSNVYAWETEEKVVSYIEHLHYEDRHSSQFWWDRSRVTADGLNYKTTLEKINLYVPNANPIWPEPTPTTEPEGETNGDGTTTTGETPATASTLLFCTNSSMSTSSKCTLPSDADKEKVKDFNLSFNYPSSFAFTAADKKIDTISTVTLTNSKASTTETIKDMSVFMFKATDLNTTLSSLFKTFTDAFEANNSGYKYTSSTPVDLDYLSANNIAMKGRVYETTINEKKKYVFIIVGNKDSEVYAFSLLVDDYLTDSDAIRKFVSGVQLGKPASTSSDKTANNVVFYNPETGKIEYK